MRKLLAVLVMAGCQPPAYYVANVYNDNGMLYMERCALDGGRHGDKPDPDHCRFDPVGPLPPEVRGRIAPAAPPPGQMIPPGGPAAPPAGSAPDSAAPPPGNGVER